MRRMSDVDVARGPPDPAEHEVVAHAEATEDAAPLRAVGDAEGDDAVRRGMRQVDAVVGDGPRSERA